MLEGGEWRDLANVRIRGIMMMASNTNDADQIRREFLMAKDCFDDIKSRYFMNDESFNVRSYGMSGDYLIAQQCGSNHVRVGSKIFAE